MLPLFAFWYNVNRTALMGDPVQVVEKLSKAL